ncbi:helix-turn-helix transcriptional regulator [Kosakonia sp. R1.Fl]|uniref:helix-turn-helix transcriptional regulator n=1 Tax=Kosakonia sp. R1.Fl TaxID=2928706 RepID=UPI00201D5016|nr:helix-turn-helix transcriptional regulator [Kosakonia sp. R1.Fl]MCL6745220.1 helix-turn-helix transcriptional regulator [Kosakonia sp. R1.Fl]
MQSVTQPKDLGSYLKSRRAQLDPVALGFHTARRRTPGLRREEVAHLACISATWYTWLEQGRGGTPSAEVLERICQALRLSEREREHVFHLALGRAPGMHSMTRGTVTERLQKVLDCMHLSPAMIRNATWDVLAWNKAATVVLSDYPSQPAHERNILRRIFLNPQARAAQADWHSLARFLVAAFRADATRAGASIEIRPLVEELSAASAEFAELWQNNDIDVMEEGTKILLHGAVGRLSLEFSSFSVEGQPDLTMVVYNPSTEEDARKISSLL